MSTIARNTSLAHSFAVRLMQHLVVPTFVLDADRRVIIWNRSCERLTGVPAADVIGTSEHWRAFYETPRLCLADMLALGKTDELDTLYQAHTEPGDSSLGLRAENWCVMPRVHKRLYLAIDAGPIYDEAGQLIAVIETLRDMTEQKLAQMALQSLAAKDGLTGLANRRAFDDALDAGWRHAQREQATLSLLLIDVDHFKAFNDTYGHQKGDECLKAVAAAIGNHAFRPSDLAARYGGEEFAVVLPATDLNGANNVAERIREAVCDLAMPHTGSDTAPHVTLSVGVATTIPLSGQTSESFVAAADAALYAAKHAGRNRVVNAPVAVVETA